jgi:hypothetical protein
VNISTGGPALTTNTVFEVPATSVTRRGDSAYVFLRTDGGVKALPVDIVGGSGPTTLISGQVDADDAVAISGVAALKALWLAGNDETGE